MGQPQTNNSITESKYKPTISNDENARYYTLRNAYSHFNDMVVNNAMNRFENAPNDERKSGNLRGVMSGFTPLEDVTYSKGSDERGNYYSIYDIYDFNVPLQDKIGKPYEIYDRVYYKDYGDGDEKPMYFTDQELLELDVDKRNFDTLALQRELSNRGYILSKSTKEGRKHESNFDGIFGEETKKALLEYQKSRKRK